MKTMIFLGPSLSLETAHSYLDTNFVPPARMGDIFRAVQRGTQVIGLIDGLFEQTPAVWHKEVLYAIDRGVSVIGGASMGALRAAELHQFGMQGIGKIFNDFASGKLEDDDEVAVVHGSAEDGYVSHSEAMVNLRYGLLQACNEGIINKQQMAALVDHAKAQFYPARCWQGVCAYARKIGADNCEDKLWHFIERIAPNQKRDDAIAVLKAVRECMAEERLEPAATFHFEQTYYWDNVVVHFDEAHSTSTATSTYIDRINTHVRLAEHDRAPLLERALLLTLAQSEAGRVGINEDDIDQSLSMSRFRRSRALNSPEQLMQWMQDNDTTRDECLDLARIESQLALLAIRKAHQIDAFIVPALKLAGRYSDVASYTTQKCNSDYIKESRALISSDDVTLIKAFEWYQDKFGTISGELSDYAAEMCLSLSELLEEILLEFLHSKGLNDGSAQIDAILKNQR